MTLVASGLPRSLLTPPPPKVDAVRVALVCLQKGRLRDAAEYAGRLPTEPPANQVWKRYIEGRVYLERGESGFAEPILRQASAAAMALGLGEPKDQEMLRFAAACLEAQAVTLRRQDRPVEAYRLHTVALGLRETHGSAAECSESAFGLAVCAELAGDPTRAEKWYRRALEAGPLDDSSVSIHAAAHTRYSMLLTALSRHDEAIAAAKSALALLIAHHPGTIEAICAGVHVAQATMRHGESLLDQGAGAAMLLKEASCLLAHAREDLAAFGQPAEKDLAWCDEQLGFVQMLQQTLEAEGAQRA